MYRYLIVFKLTTNFSFELIGKSNGVEFFVRVRVNLLQLCSHHGTTVIIRNHPPEIMFKAFEIAGYPASEVEKRFGGMVKAFTYGAPPHGGCAAGIDRIVMLLADTTNIREVIMFPMNQRAEDLLMNAPSEPTNDQLRELRLRVLPKDA